MFDETILNATASDFGDADWGPLERFLPYELCGGFMYMQTTTLEGGIVLHNYKHSDTRRYLRLDDSADAWENIDHGRFRRMRHTDALEQVFPTYWLLEHATDEDRALLKQAFETAHERGDGDEAAGAHILPASPACAFRRLP